MTLVQLAPLAIEISIALSVLGVGLNATFADEIAFLRKPRLLLRAVFAMNVVMFALAMAAVLLLDLPTALNVGLVVLALSPVPPAMPRRLVLAGSTVSSAVRLVTGVSVMAIAIVPLGVALGGILVGRDLRMPISTVASAVLLRVIIPLSIGIALRRFAPRVAERMARPLQRSAAVVLLLGAVSLLFAAWPILSSMFGYGVLTALILFSVSGLAIGHVLGGPDESHRTLLALVTSARHPGMMLTMARINYPAEHGVVAIAIFHVFVAALVALPYLAWRRGLHARSGGGATATPG
jgi:BASS family bile acid:Na+ symporter